MLPWDAWVLSSQPNDRSFDRSTSLFSTRPIIVVARVSQGISRVTGKVHQVGAVAALARSVSEIESSISGSVVFVCVCWCCLCSFCHSPLRPYRNCTVCLHPGCSSSEPETPLQVKPSAAQKKPYGIQVYNVVYIYICI